MLKLLQMAFAIAFVLEYNLKNYFPLFSFFPLTENPHPMLKGPLLDGVQSHLVLLDGGEFGTEIMRRMTFRRGKLGQAHLKRIVLVHEELIRASTKENQP